MSENQQDFEQVLSTQLKPCPFCGGDGVRVGNYSEGVWYAICDGCGTESGYKTTREAAIAAWNQRAGDVGTERLLRELCAGYWVARVYNQFDSDRRRKWGDPGDFTNKEAAQKAAEEEARSHGDTASFGCAEWELHLDGDQILNRCMDAIRDLEDDQ